MSALRHHIVGALLAAPAVLVTLAAQPASVEPALTILRGGRTVLEYSLPELAALPQATIVTENDFMDGALAYRGPSVAAVLRPLGLDPEAQLDFIAANDYVVSIPFSDLLEFRAILAMEVDGTPLSRRDKGPLWLMYPISSHPELREPAYLDRLIWQVVRIDVGAR